MCAVILQGINLACFHSDPFCLVELFLTDALIWVPQKYLIDV